MRKVEKEISNVPRSSTATPSSSDISAIYNNMKNLNLKNVPMIDPPPLPTAIKSHVVGVDFPSKGGVYSIPPEVQVNFNSQAHNSGAVLSALRTLQDKIRKLEGERAYFSDQCNDLKAQLQNLRNHSDHDALLSNVSIQVLHKYVMIEAHEMSIEVLLSSRGT
jgi:hypothetical protein